jgi:dolichol-phosphate mannosyltransferase
MEKHAAQDAVILIPSLEPDDRLPAYIRRLKEGGFARIVVVDDGSSADCRSTFDAVASLPECTVLRHAANRGKGAALKTALAFVAEHFPSCAGIVTVDADGQHAPEDCRRMAEAMESGCRALYLGVRKFALGSTPFRSWWGNRCTALLFALLSGRWVPDTQTGLRAFKSSDIQFFLSVPGDGYEYEMAALMRAARDGMPFCKIPIHTIYEADNASSHFSPLQDTIRIHRALFAARFGGRRA